MAQGETIGQMTARIERQRIAEAAAQKTAEQQLTQAAANKTAQVQREVDAHRKAEKNALAQIYKEAHWTAIRNGFTLKYIDFRRALRLRKGIPFTRSIICQAGTREIILTAESDPRYGVHLNAQQNIFDLHEIPGNKEGSGGGHRNTWETEFTEHWNMHNATENLKEKMAEFLADNPSLLRDTNVPFLKTGVITLALIYTLAANGCFSKKPEQQIREMPSIFENLKTTPQP